MCLRVEISLDSVWGRLPGPRQANPSFGNRWIFKNAVASFKTIISVMFLYETFTLRKNLARGMWRIFSLYHFEDNFYHARSISVVIILSPPYLTTFPTPHSPEPSFPGVSAHTVPLPDTPLLRVPAHLRLVPSLLISFHLLLQCPPQSLILWQNIRASPVQQLSLVSKYLVSHRTKHLLFSNYFRSVNSVSPN